jgi:hypothetical protein
MVLTGSYGLSVQPVPVPIRDDYDPTWLSLVRAISSIGSAGWIAEMACLKTTCVPLPRTSITVKLSNCLIWPCSLMPLTRNIVTSSLLSRRCLRNRSWMGGVPGVTTFEPSSSILRDAASHTIAVAAKYRQLINGSWATLARSDVAPEYNLDGSRDDQPNLSFRST